MKKISQMLMITVLFVISALACSAQEHVATRIPIMFREAKTNRVEGEQNLTPFWERINDKDVIECKVMLIGDSHVAGKVFPRQLEQRLKGMWPKVLFSSISKNGVQLNYFLEEENVGEINSFNPDLLIVSVGTNESHGKFFPDAYQSLMQQFIDTISASNPACTFLFTTTPGSHLRNYGYKYTGKGKHRKKIRYIISKEPNNINQDVSDCQVDFCKKHNIAIWDLYDIVGGKNAACRNWCITNLMRDDAVHFYPEGYVLQADLLFDAMYYSYKNYKK